MYTDASCADRKVAYLAHLFNSVFYPVSRYPRRHFLDPYHIVGVTGLDNAIWPMNTRNFPFFHSSDISGTSSDWLPEWQSPLGSSSYSMSCAACAEWNVHSMDSASSPTTYIKFFPNSESVTGLTVNSLCIGGHIVALQIYKASSYTTFRSQCYTHSKAQNGILSSRTSSRPRAYSIKILFQAD